MVTSTQKIKMQVNQPKILGCFYPFVFSVCELELQIILVDLCITCKLNMDWYEGTTPQDRAR